jgi:hypothetical protein
VELVVRELVLSVGSGHLTAAHMLECRPVSGCIQVGMRQISTLGCRSLPVIFPSISVAITFTTCLVTSRVFWVCRGHQRNTTHGVDRSCQLLTQSHGSGTRRAVPPPRHRDGARPGNDARSWTQPSSLCGSGLRPGAARKRPLLSRARGRAASKIKWCAGTTDMNARGGMATFSAPAAYDTASR